MATIQDSEISEYFALVDSSGSGKISGDQIEVLLRALGHNPSKDEIQRYGTVDLKGFKAIVPKQRASISKDAIRTAVTTLNAKESSSQVVSKDFLRRLLTQIGDKLTDAEFEEFISDPALEVTSDGRVNIKNLVDVLGV